MPCPDHSKPATIPPVEPLDTPHDWHQRIATRAAEAQQHGMAEAARRWHARGDLGRHVLAVVEAMEKPR